MRQLPSRLKAQLQGLTGILDHFGAWLPHLALRLFLAHEFWLAGVEKLQGSNWFSEIHAQFPFPFNLLPVELSWQLATWLELLAPVALVLGLGTRFCALALACLTLVAIASVHAGHGYNVCEQGWKLPFIYLIMFLPLLFMGGGRLSVDHWLRKHFLNTERRLWS